MKNNFLFRKVTLLLCSAVFLLASCRKDDKPAPAGENGAATVKYAVDVTPDDNRDWGEATDWLGDGGRLSMLGKPQLPVKSPDLFENVPTGIRVEQSSYVYVTFVGEIADFNNALGYYYYNPQETGELDEEDFLNQLFLSGEDGNVYFQNIIYTQTKKLAHGYTFKLGIQESNDIQPFPAGYVVGFCIFPNSGSGDGLSPINNWGELPAIKLRNGKPFYITTDWQFNEGQTLSHTVGKTPCGDYVFAFEDLNSAYSKSSDDDFNDLVLVVGDNLDSRSTTKLATYGSGATPFVIPARPGDEGECGQTTTELNLGATYLAVQLNEDKGIHIQNGSGDYSIEGIKAIDEITGADLDIAGYVLDGDLLTLRGRISGKTTITVKDNVTNATASLELQIIQTEIPQNFVIIPWGSFTMGCTAGDEDCEANENPAHQVTLTKTYAMGITEVTNTQYCTFLNAWNIQHPDDVITGSINNHYTASNLSDKNIWFQWDRNVTHINWWPQEIEYTNNQWKPKQGKGDYPMVVLSWFGAEAYCDFYGFRLPTEAQWEYAARGGNDFIYSGSDNIDEVAWYGAPVESLSHAVKGKEANGYGLYDMSGNVMEICYDWLGNYTNDAKIDPVGIIVENADDKFTIRGGTWADWTTICRVSSRYYGRNSYASGIGFRVVFDIQ